MSCKLVVTPGEPAAIGPDLMALWAQQEKPYQVCAITDADMLAERAELLKQKISIKRANDFSGTYTQKAGELSVFHVPTPIKTQVGVLDANNSPFVLSCLDHAVQACTEGHAQAMVTGPLHKGIINSSGVPFKGHTEYLAQATNTDQVVMMLAHKSLRVALVTTHVPLRKVPDLITTDYLTRVIKITDRALRNQFGIERPSIAVLGLNPHAGEQGYLGQEEITVMQPTIESLRAEGYCLTDPLPADTAFGAKQLEAHDLFLAMYHDQGLPVLKYSGFGASVNITLGLPIIRTSVDHGTALELAGTGKIQTSSFNHAIEQAAWMARHRKAHTS